MITGELLRTRNQVPMYRRDAPALKALVHRVVAARMQSREMETRATLARGWPDARRMEPDALVAAQARTLAALGCCRGDPA